MLTQLQLGRRDASSCALMDGPLAIGWIRTGVIGFGGFEDRREAHAAAMAAAVIVLHRAASRFEGGLAEFPGHVPETDAVRANGMVVGRLLSPRATRSDLAGYGYEIAVPAQTWLAVMLEIAERIHRGVLGTRRTVDARADALAVAS